MTAPAAWAAAQVEFGDEAPAATVTAGQADFSAAASGVVQAWRPALAGCGDGCAAPALLLLLPAGQERASLRSAPTTVRPAVMATHCVDRNGLAVPCQAGWVR